MSVKIRPMSDSDFSRLSRGRFITNCVNSELGSASSASIFGDQTNRTNKLTHTKSADTFHLPGVIKLTMPVPNYFVAEKNLRLLTRMLPTRIFKPKRGQNVTVSSIMDCSFIYDLSEKEFISMTSGAKENLEYVTGRYLIGAEVLRYFMEQYDVEREIKIVLSSIIGDACKSLVDDYKLRKVVEGLKSFSITKGTGDLHIIDEYYATWKPWASEKGSINVAERPDILESITNYLDQMIYPILNKLSISYLLQMREDEYMQNFLNLVQNYVAVLPIGFRKGIDGEQSPVTKAYNDLIRTNERLRTVLGQTSNLTVSRVTNAYKQLLKDVKYVVSDSRAKMTGSVGYKSLAETLVGKMGLIRSHLQSVIVDNAGRTVIIGDIYMSVDSIGIPYKMLRDMCDVYYMKYLNIMDRRNDKKVKMTPKDKLDKLKEFKSDSNIKHMKSFIDRLCDVPGVQQDTMYKICREICPMFMIAAGRQPTLWKFGIQAFKVVPVDGSAIHLAPLYVVAFNADFDGDQMHSAICTSLEAQEELRNKMANIKSVFYSRDGSCHIFPRHEIIYGLWYASLQKPTGPVVIDEPKLTNAVKLTIFEMVESDTHPLNATVVIAGRRWSLGQMAVKCCAGVNYADYIIGDKELRKASILSTNNKNPTINETPDGVCTDKWCKAFLTLIYDESVANEKLFIETVNNYTIIGTQIATNYPPDVSLMSTPDISRYVKEFEEDIKEVQLHYNAGLETDSGYYRKYADAYKRMSSRLKKDMYNPASSVFVGENNGFWDMTRSGCRGSDSTMFQMFGMKGRVQRNSNETFNAIIKDSMSAGLTGLEHFICAYGGRQGQIDKSLETATPGYIYRTMVNAMCNLKITDYDCGTDDGLLIDWKFLEFMVGNGAIEEALLYDKVKDMFTSMVIGRHVVEKKDGEVTKKNVQDLFDHYIVSITKSDDGQLEFDYKPGVHLRSPITCSNPCCQKCYGIDLSKHKKPVVGHYVGLEAAQSISEPLSQLILKNFQKGGVATEGGLTNAFDLINAYINLRQLDKATAGQPRFTDVISPYDGKVEYMDLGNGVRHIFIVNREGDKLNATPYVLYNNVRLKPFVERGQGLMLESGNYELAELKSVLGIDDTIRYLTVKLWQIFHDQDVNLKHFECLVESLMFYICVSGSGNDFESGKAYTHIEYEKNKNYGNAKFCKVLCPILRVPEMSNNILRGLMFEQQGRAMSTHVLKNDEDDLTDVWVRGSLGLRI